MTNKSISQLLGVRATRNKMSKSQILTALNALPNPDPILRKTGKHLSVYKDIKRDEDVGSDIRNRLNGILKYEYQIEGRDVALNTYIESMISELDVPNIIRSMFNGILYGYQPLEVLWRQVNGKLSITDVVEKPLDWFRYDSNNQLRLITSDNNNGELLPAKKFLVVRNSPTYENPYGEALLAECYWSVMFKKNGFKFWLKFAEKFGMPFLVGKLQVGSTDDEHYDISEKLFQLSEDGVVTVEEGTEVTMLQQSGTASSTLFDRIVEVCKESITRSILGHSGVNKSTPGKLGGENNADAIRNDFIESDVAMIEQQFNKLIKWFVQVNFGYQTEYPEFKMIDKHSLEIERAQRDKIIFSLPNVRPTKAYFVRHYSFADDEIDIIQDQQKFESPQSSTEVKDKPVSDIPKSFPDQNAVNSLIDKSVEASFESMDSILTEIVDMIVKQKDYNEVQDKIHTLLPNLDTSGFESILSQALFLADTIGRVSVLKEE